MPAAAADAAIGMMDGAYFTSRKEILDFFNSLLSLNLTKIEQTASGAVACQLTEYIFPGSIPLHRVNWEAKSAYEFVTNYKLLQAAFNKHNVQRYVDVDKLIRAKYQDNLEFCQWLKAFYDQAAPPIREDYDPVAVRSKGKGGKNASERFQKNASQYGSKPVVTTSRTRTSSAAVRKSPTNAGSARAKPQKENPSVPSRKQSGSSSNGAVPASEAVAANINLTKKNAELTKKKAELESTVEMVEKERDFYFEKLQHVEFMIQVFEEQRKKNGVVDVDTSGLLQRIFKVLYATSDDNITVDENANVIGGYVAAELSNDDKGGDLSASSEQLLSEEEETLAIDR